MYFFFSKINSKLNKFLSCLFFFSTEKKFYKYDSIKTKVIKYKIKKKDWNNTSISKSKIKDFYFLEKKINFINLYCDPYSGFFFSKFGRPIISEHIFKHYINIYFNFFLPFFISKKKIKNGVFFGGYFMENYCHFLFYIYVPILLLPKHYTLVFDSRLLNQNFFIDYLNIIKDRKYVFINKPTFFEKGLIYQKKYLGKKELKNIGSITLKKNNNYKIIYLKRQSLIRNINSYNEIKIISFLKKRFKNIKIITCKNLSLKDQIKIFSNTQIIIGTHGADFANIIFGLKNIKKIIEFCHPLFFTGVYTRISKLYNIKHTQIVGTHSGNNYEFSVDINILKKII